MNNAGAKRKCMCAQQRVQPCNTLKCLKKKNCSGQEHYNETALSEAYYIRGNLYEEIYVDMQHIRQ